jgi:hypothetical protein
MWVLPPTLQGPHPVEAPLPLLWPHLLWGLLHTEGPPATSVQHQVGDAVEQVTCCSHLQCVIPPNDRNVGSYRMLTAGTVRHSWYLRMARMGLSWENLVATMQQWFADERISCASLLHGIDTFSTADPCPLLSNTGCAQGAPAHV